MSRRPEYADSAMPYTRRMNPLLRDFYGHQAWADAEHWKAIGAWPPARDDDAIRKRLHHIHLVQRTFLWAAGDQKREITFTAPEDFSSFDELKAYARGYHDVVKPFMNTVSAARLTEPLSIPWFKNPPLTITVEEALTQGAMHSHYHRGQNATRLRELGGEPPLTDFIVWLWKARPDPVWI